MLYQGGEMIVLGLAAIFAVAAVGWFGFGYIKKPDGWIEGTLLLLIFAGILYMLGQGSAESNFDSGEARAAIEQDYPHIHPLEIDVRENYIRFQDGDARCEGVLMKDGGLWRIRNVDCDENYFEEYDDTSGDE